MIIVLPKLSVPLQLRKKAVMIQHGYHCWYCGKAATDVDHIVPKSKGGTDEAKNLVACCRSCNASKGQNSLPPDVLREATITARCMAEAVDELAYTMRYAEEQARERRSNIRPWKIA